MTDSWKISLGSFGLLAAVCIGSAALAAGTEADFKQAYAAADAAEKEAGRLRNQWLATEAALADARKAAEKSDFDGAVAAAREAEALAKASIFQATSEKDAWKNLEIR
jgi:putative intracellular protease/amidase